jgi:predicted dinucleotide-utilizing enzyme
MEQHAIAIIGLGRVGTFFLRRMLEHKDKNIRVAAVVEPKETEGRRLAAEHSIPVVSLDDLVDMGEEVDIIFELTGNADLRLDLRNRLFNAMNSHTVLVPESVAHLFSKFLGPGEFPDVHTSKGY